MRVCVLALGAVILDHHLLSAERIHPKSHLQNHIVLVEAPWLPPLCEIPLCLFASRPAAKLGAAELLN